jgi:hypothetical protein
VNMLAIDQGTSATKALVVSDGGRVLGEGSAPVRPQAGPGGAVEQAPQELLDSIVAAGRAALESPGEPVVAVGDWTPVGTFERRMAPDEAAERLERRRAATAALAALPA